MFIARDRCEPIHKKTICIRHTSQPSTICNNYNIWMSSSRMGEGWVVRWAAPSLCNLNLTACCALPWTICCGCSLMHLRKGGPEEVT